MESPIFVEDKNHKLDIGKFERLLRDQIEGSTVGK